MKKTVKKEVIVCDKCNKEEEHVEKCLSCKVEMCYDCREKYGITYNHAVYFQGDGDGFYCYDCDSKLKSSRKNERYNAYKVIELLKVELEDWHKSFKKRQEIAEKALKAITD